MSLPSANETSPKPWWMFGHVWLVIAGPAIVVVAGFVTFYLAVRSPDPVLSTQPAATGQSESSAGSLSEAPAVQARNHAATGTLPTPAENQRKP